MTARRIHALVALGLMLLAFAGAYAWKPTKHLADTLPKVDLETMFPKSFGDWTVDTRVPVQVISPDQAALLNKIYNQTLSRTYVNGQGERIMLSVAYGGDQSDGMNAHRPEVCYPAQGFQVNGNQRVVLSIADRSVDARQLETRLGGRTEPLVYWVVVADRTTTSGTEQKLAQLRYGLRGQIPDGMLVRVSSIDPNAVKAQTIHLEFLRELALAMDESVRSRVFGARLRPVAKSLQPPRITTQDRVVGPRLTTYRSGFLSLWA